jgi:hypothetical protein
MGRATFTKFKVRERPATGSRAYLLRLSDHMDLRSNFSTLCYGCMAGFMIAAVLWTTLLLGAWLFLGRPLGRRSTWTPPAEEETPEEKDIDPAAM